MKIQKNKKDQKEVLDKLKKYQDILFLNHYKLTVEFADKQEGAFLATSTTDYPYLRVHIIIYPLFWKDIEEERNDTLIHELVHVIVNPLYFKCLNQANQAERKWIEDLAENTVQHLTNIINDNIK